jgi:hypothetical protein
MTTNNVKLLNEITHNFTQIIENYADNYKVLEKINEYIYGELKTNIKKIHRDVENLEKIEKEKNYFINHFLSSKENIFYYVKDKDVFIHYDMQHYKIYEEDKIASNIYREITENYPSLNASKFDVLQDIINELKQQTIHDCLPESFTIQNIIKYLTTYFFESKDDAKYFCCVIGDIVLNKKNNIDICVNNHLIDFIETFDIVIGGELGELYDYYSNQLSKEIVHSNALNNHRIIKSTSEDQQYLWKGFLNKHAIDILIVCIHYSKRYVSSENYIKHHKSSATILYLKNNNVKEIVQDFCLNDLTVRKNVSINYENMEYLWHTFLDEKQIPKNVLTSTELHRYTQSYVKYDNDNMNYLSIFNKDSQMIQDVKQFLKTELVIDINDELEISELISIFEESYYSVDESKMISLLKYFTMCSMTLDNKIIMDTRCLLWDKKGGLDTFIKIMKKGAVANYPINKNLSINTIYTKYCKYTSNNGDINKIVTKNYFVNYIIKKIPSECIIFNKISSMYWYS